jgi:hypothetical protein
MSKDPYLWDKSGDADAEVARLEGVLRELGYRPGRRERRRMMWRVGGLVAAACVVLVLLWPKERASTWQVGGKALYAGDVVQEGRLNSAVVGSLELERGSRLRLQGGNHFALERGVLHALVWAAPKEFVVDTPAAKAIDLGCRYTLRVGEDGGGLLQVETGWVAFQHGGREAFIPAGAQCRTRVGKGPGTPVYADASEALKRAVEEWDGGDLGALPRVLKEARERDGITLWHLLGRTDSEGRRRVCERLGAFVKLADREAIVRGERKAIDGVWEELGLGGMEWWRGWKRGWQN